jgi:hypothetical protein
LYYPSQSILIKTQGVSKQMENWKTFGEDEEEDDGGDDDDSW